MTPDASDFRVPITNARRVRRNVRVRLVVTRRIKSRIDTTSGLKTLKRNGITKVKFDVRSKGLPEGTFNVLVLIRSPNARRTLSRSRLRLVVAGDDTEPPVDRVPEPAIEALTVVARRGFGDEPDPVCATLLVEDCLPLAGPAWDDEELKEKVAANETIAVVAGTRRRLLLVRWSGSTSRLAGPTGDLTGLDLSIAGEAVPDTYEGTVDLLPKDPDNGTVALTLIITDPWTWALLVLVLGLVLGLWMRRWRSLGGKVSRLRSDAAEARKAFNCGMSACGYTIEKEVKEKSGALKKQIAKIDVWFGIELSEEDPAYKAAAANVETLRAHGEAWCAFVEEIAELKQAIDDMPTVPPPKWPADVRDVTAGPRWLADARRLANPGNDGHLDFEKLDALRPQVRKTANLVGSWRTLNARLTMLDKVVALIETTCAPAFDEVQQETFHEAKLRLSETRWDLWSAETAEEVEDRAAEADLQEAERQVARLADCFLPPDSRRKAAAVAARTFAAMDDLPERERAAEGDAGPPAPELPEPDVIIWREQVRSRIFNRVILLILLAGSLYTGMNELYFDDVVYGTWTDYLGTLAWGLGSVFTLDALSSALDKLRVRVGSA